MSSEDSIVKNEDWISAVHVRLLKSRKVFLSGEVDMALANRVMAELLLLEEQAADPITLYINSPGGELTSGLAIYDTIKGLKCEVRTVCAGLAASIATVVLAGGTRGKRTSYRNARILIHQPLGGVRGQATDIEIHAREILKARENINRILAEDTSQSVKKLEKDTNRDFWMSAEEAKEYGIIDSLC